MARCSQLGLFLVLLSAGCNSGAEGIDAPKGPGDSGTDASLIDAADAASLVDAADPSTLVDAADAALVDAAPAVDASSCTPSGSEVCGNGMDDDCDGTVDGGSELCGNLIDDDCNGTVDDCAMLGSKRIEGRLEFYGYVHDPRATRGSVWIADRWPNPTNPFPDALNCPGRTTGPWCNVNEANNNGPDLYQLGDDLTATSHGVTGIWTIPETWDGKLIIAINGSDGSNWVCSGAPDAPVSCGSFSRIIYPR